MNDCWDFLKSHYMYTMFMIMVMTDLEVRLQSKDVYYGFTKLRIISLQLLLISSREILKEILEIV